MKNRTPFLPLILVVIVLVAGCATTKYSYQEPAYTQPVEKGSVLQQFSLEPSLEEKILAMNPEELCKGQCRS